MAKRKKRDIPPGHALCRYFFNLNRASFEHLDLKDDEVVYYLTDLLVRFVRAGHLYRLKDASGENLVHLVDMLLEAEGHPASEAREIRKHIGDHTLFLLGIFPESLKRPRRPDSRGFYLSQGKMSYRAVAEMERYLPVSALFRRLADTFEQCVKALNLGREYFCDPAYRYICRQMSW